jgi:V8-like Glu-specific endopeptidase
MKPAMRPRLLASALLLASAVASAPANALVGAVPDERFADRVAMVLMRGPGEAGFCSALVLDDRTLLTAAHCLRPVRDMAVHYRDGSGEPVVIPVEAAVAHPQYRPDAIRARVESIDVALLRTARSLGARFEGAALASGDGPAVGESVILTGYGSTHEGDWKSGGALRSVTLAVRAPFSPVLVWAADRDGRLAGACSGDSGAPIWSADGVTAVAIAAWAQAQHGRGCGGLTQGPRLAPLKEWIDAAKRKLAGGV